MKAAASWRRRGGGESAKQLGAGAATGGDAKGGGKDASGPTPSLTAEDLKELEDLDLSELDKDKPEKKN